MTTCGMMNVLTGLYVTVVAKICNREHDFQVMKHAQRDKELIEEMQELLRSADKCKKGRLSREVILKVLHKPENNKLVRELGLELEVVKGLYKLLDVEERNRVGIDDFCQGLLHLTGSVNNVHMAMLMLQSKRTLVKLNHFETAMAAHFNRLENCITLDHV